MKQRYALAHGRILQELGNLEHVVERVEKGMEKARSDSVDAQLFLDSVALNLHDFYSGLERIFQYIASQIDQSVPSGAEWHRELLRQMQVENAGTRPAVLSAETVKCLDEYLRFRHIVRNVYTFEFDAERLERLAQDLAPTFDQARKDLLAYTDFLERMISE